MRPGLVIFDCDGVLVDTEPTSNAVMAEILQREGMEIDVAGSMARFLGKSMKSVQEEVEAEIGRSLGPDWTAMVRDATIEAFREHGVAAISGVKAAISRIDTAGIPLCVASSGSIAKMHSSLGSAGLLDRLQDVLFTSDSVERGKPAPDLVLHAAAQMGCSPSNCVVIEDSRTGVRAAIAAGMRTLAYIGASNGPIQEMTALGAEVFDNMTRLPALIGLEEAA
ncbi:MAG: HAD family hydrolase [Pseudomonadota bacterium]